MLLTVGCRAPIADVRPIEASLLLDCPVEGALVLEALDDAAPTAASFIEVSVDRSADAPALPPSARAFIARARAGNALGVLHAREEGAFGPIYRAFTACAFRDSAGARARFPSLLAPTVASAGGYAVIAGGRDARGDARSDTLVIDGTKAIADRVGLRRRRAEAAVAITGDRAIVAGGNAVDLWEDAEVIDLSRRVVLPDAIALGEKRSQATAVTLASGAVLLAGGRGPTSALRSMEILEVGRPVARTIDVASLSRPRRAPLALRAATGEILILGGTDDAGAPVPDVEVFDSTARTLLVTWPLAIGANHAATALPSGAVLVVHGDATSTRAVLARIDGVDPLPEPPHRLRPSLIAATDGAPFLFNGAFTRFDPFTHRFADYPTPAGFTPTDIEPFALDGGVLATLRREDSMLAVRALRYDVRPPLISDAESLGLGSTQHLSADRPGPSVVREGLVITPRARVAITDATYRGLVVRLAASGRDLPIVELRGEDGVLVARVGDTSCPWPASSAPTAEIARERDGAMRVTIGELTRDCTPLATRERVWLSMVAGTAEARIRGVTITRR